MSSAGIKFAQTVLIAYASARASAKVESLGGFAARGQASALAAPDVESTGNKVTAGARTWHEFVQRAANLRTAADIRRYRSS
jgi:hypothetical protein